MAKLERMELKKKYPISIAVKLLMMVAIVMGFYIRGCSRKNAAKLIKISYVEVAEVTSANIDIYFMVDNAASVMLKKNFLIKVFLENGEEVASKITTVSLEPKSRKKYLKVLSKFNMAVNSETKVSHATVEMYEPNFFNFSD